MKFYLSLINKYSKPIRITFLAFCVLLTTGILTAFASKTDAQILNTKISVKFESENLFSAIKKIEAKTKNVFAYDESYLGLKTIDVKTANFTNESLENVLKFLLKGSGISYK
jgi:hypothetical protein